MSYLSGIASRVTKKLSDIAGKMCGGIAHRYRGDYVDPLEKGVGRNVDTALHGKRQVDEADTYAAEDRRRESVPAADADAAAVPRGRLMSVEEFAERLAEAERSGPPVRTADLSGQNSVTVLLTYPNGFRVVEKSGLWREGRDAEVLASAVGHATKTPVPPVIPVGEDTVRMPWMPGRTIWGPDEDPGAIRVMEGLRNHPDARRLGRFDLLIDNWDRQNNWLFHGKLDDRDLDGEDLGKNAKHLYGYDHAFSFGKPMDPADSPFSRHYVSASRSDNEDDPYVWNEDDPYVWVDNNGESRSELKEFRGNIHALRPLFEEYGRLDWHTRVLNRLDKLIQHADVL